jgi:hypothetical protein
MRLTSSTWSGSQSYGYYIPEDGGPANTLPEPPVAAPMSDNVVRMPSRQSG